jgi:Domain of Unknown Function (DUF1206)
MAMIGSMPFRRSDGEKVIGWLVRAGFVARGITYGLVGGMALALGAGSAPTTPNQQGALALIARAPLGRVALFVIATSLLAYALWKLWQGLAPGGGELWDRIANLAGGLVYVGFFAVAVRVLVGDRSSGSSEPKHAASGVLSWPGGRWIVGAAGVILIAISAYQAYTAVRGQFEDDSRTERMDPAGRTSFRVLGRVGLVSRAAVFALIGYFVLRTAIAYKPSDTVGLDGALARIHGQPLGPLLLGLTAAGLIVFAVFSLLEARYRKL